MASSSHDYSTLELDTSRSARSHHDREGLQVAQDHGKVYVPSSSTPPTYNYSQDPEPLVNKDFSHAQNTTPPVQRPWWKKKRFFVTAIVLLVLIAIGLGVGLGVALSSSDDDDNSSSNSPPPTDPEAASAALLRRNIAAVSTRDGSTNRTWVFYQNTDGKIVRSGGTSLDGPWSNDDTGATGRNETALAATVSRPGQPLAISVFYIGDQDILHDVNFSEGTGRWEPGTLANEEYKVMPNSSIAALYNHCRHCFNYTLIAYQDVNGFIQLRNLTSQGWSDTNGQLVNGVTAFGGGLALQPFFKNDTADQINLYYQKITARNVVLAAFQESLPKSNAPGWRVTAQTFDPAQPYGTPIAAGSPYSNITNGLESWIQMLTLSKTGVKVTTWEGTANNWTSYFASPSEFANSTVNPKLYGKLAMTASGAAFAVTQEGDKTPRIESWQLRDDFNSWDQVGAIDAW